MKLKELMEADGQIVKNVFAYVDHNRRRKMLHVGENNGKFFIRLVGDDGNEEDLTKPMALRGKLADTIKKVWSSVREQDPKTRATALKNALDKNTKIDWTIKQ